MLNQNQLECRPDTFRCLIFFITWLLLYQSPTWAGDGYGTIVLPNGKMIAIYRSSRQGRTEAFVARFKKNGTFEGCVRESRSAYQARRAYMMAQAKWRAGYVPRAFPCVAAIKF